MSTGSDGRPIVEVQSAPPSQQDEGDPVPAWLVGGLAFVATGAFLSTLVCLAFRRVLPRLPRRTFVIMAGASVVALALLIISLIRLAIEGIFSLSFLFTMQWQGWLLLLAMTVAALLVAAFFAPRPRKVDLKVFE